MRNFAREKSFINVIYGLNVGRFDFVEKEPDVRFVSQVSEHGWTGRLEFECEKVVRSRYRNIEPWLEFFGWERATLIKRRQELLHVAIEPVLGEVLLRATCSTSRLPASAGRINGIDVAGGLS